MANIMSVDVEDWFHLLALSSTPAIGDEQAADSQTQDQHQRPSPCKSRTRNSLAPPISRKTVNTPIKSVKEERGPARRG